MRGRRWGITNRKNITSVIEANFLTFCAGYVDAYTFIVRGNTLVAGQTGMWFLSVGLIQQNVSDASAKVTTLLFFYDGCLFWHCIRKNYELLKADFVLIPLAVLSP